MMVGRFALVWELELGAFSLLLLALGPTANMYSSRSFSFFTASTGYGVDPPNDKRSATLLKDPHLHKKIRISTKKNLY